MNKSKYTKTFLQLLSSKLSNRKEYADDEYICEIIKEDDKVIIHFSHVDKILSLTKRSSLKYSVLDVVATAYFNDIAFIDDRTIATHDKNLVPGRYIYQQSNRRLIRRWRRMEE